MNTFTSSLSVSFVLEFALSSAPLGDLNRSGVKRRDRSKDMPRRAKTASQMKSEMDRKEKSREQRNNSKGK